MRIKNPGTGKIDDQATNGLLGVPGSLAYRLHELDRHLHGWERWFKAALEAGGYEIAGTTSPDFDGSFYATGSLNGQFVYTNRDGSGFLWWDNVDSWIISAASGVTGADYFKRTNASPIGAYTNEGSATGTVTGADISDEEHVADSIEGADGEFTVDAGNDDWGSWLQILGSDDTPAMSGSVKYDLHRIVVTSTERTQLYNVQIAFGTSGAAALSAGTYTEFCYKPQSAANDSAVHEVKTRRQNVGTKAWVRVKVPGQNTAEMDFCHGIHEYEG